MKRKVALLITISLIFTACNSKWNKPNPDLSKEFFEKQQSILEENQKKYKENPEDKEALFEIAYRNQLIGNYKNAEKYYKKILKEDSNNYQALNNLADVYFEVEEYEKAAEYIKILYQNNQDDTQVIKKAVKMLLQADDPDNAQKALENYTKLKKDENVSMIISDLYNEIYNYRNKNEKK